MAKTFTSCLTFLLLPFFLYGQGKLIQPGASYEAGVLVFKIKEDPMPDKSSRKGNYPPGTSAAAQELAQLLGARSVQPAIAYAALQKQQAAGRSRQHPLSNIYKMEIGNMPLEEALKRLKSHKNVVYAEPYYLPELLETPDDEFLAQQKHLLNIKAATAWDINQGSSQVIIGILDTGIDFAHPDLKENLYLNTADPLDGIDNDGDGFIDNYYGWDFANNDNDPTADNSGHGTLVAGFSSASTNNDIGIAGTGYKCKYMPIKVFRSENNRFGGGYEAMVYAADMGCDVLNLSWGAANFRSQYVQDIVNYVALEKDVVIVAAAGNTAEELNFYPASYDHVLSVSSSDYTDKKADYATWSSYVDLLAPGLDVFSTKNGGGYGTSTGTSFASPQVAGAAALVRSYFPELSALQVIERLRMSADDVSGVAGNEGFKEKIGKGRLNMARALDRSISPAVRMQRFEVFNGSGPFAFYNDTLEIRMDFINYLSPTTDLEIKLTSTSSYVTEIDSVISFTALNTLEEVRNQDKPFRVYLHPDLPSDEVITFRLGYSDINYTDYQYFELHTSGSYLDFKADELSLTISSSGNLGYNYDYNLQGTGFRFQNKPLAHNLGLVIAHSPSAVANNALLSISPAFRDKDFQVQDRLKLHNNGSASRDARSVFKTILSDKMPLDMLVEQKILGWEDTLASAGIVLEYRLINTGSVALEQLHTGIFADFDILEFYKNRAAYDASHILGYAYDHEESQFAGLALISEQTPAFHALDLADRNGNQSEVADDTLSRDEKYQYLANGIGKETAGIAGNGNDIAQFLGGTLPLLEPKQSQKIAFALLSASSLAALQEAALQAKTRYQEYLANPPLHAKLLSCPGKALTVQPSGGQWFQFYTDPYGKELVAEGASITLENLLSDTTFYIAKADLSYLGDIERIEVQVKDPLAVFSMSSDTLSIVEGETAVLALSDESEFAASWKWTFNNGYSSSKQHPKAYFKTAGTYTIALEMTNIAGCVDDSSRQLVVVYKNQPPLFENQLLCTPGIASLEAKDGAVFKLYSDPQKQNQLFEGAYYETGILQKDTLFYASQGDGHYESELKPITISVYDAGVSVRHGIDSTAESRYGLWLAADIQQPEMLARLEWYINGVFASNDLRLQWPYTASDTLLKAQAIAYYHSGCQASAQKDIRLLTSDTPVLAALKACIGDTPLIRPAEEGIYYFYADESKSELLKKGREYLLEPLSSSRTVFVSNVDQGGESPVAAAHVLLPDSLAYFQASADTVGLNRSGTVSFSNPHPEAVEWLWNFGDGFSSTLQAPEHSYQAPGTYTVSLSAKSSGGCTDVFSRSLLVVQTTGLFGDKHKPQHFKSYPNPAGDYIVLDLPLLSGPGIVHVLNLNGSLISSQPVAAGQILLRLSVKELPPGMYMLQLQTAEKVFMNRFVKK